MSVERRLDVPPHLLHQKSSPLPSSGSSRAPSSAPSIPPSLCYNLFAVAHVLCGRGTLGVCTRQTVTRKTTLKLCAVCSVVYAQLMAARNTRSPPRRSPSRRLCPVAPCTPWRLQSWSPSVRHHVHCPQLAQRDLPPSARPPSFRPASQRFDTSRRNSPTYVPSWREDDVLTHTADSYNGDALPAVELHNFMAVPGRGVVSDCALQSGVHRQVLH